MAVSTSTHGLRPHSTALSIEGKRLLQKVIYQGQQV